MKKVKVSFPSDVLLKFDAGSEHEFPVIGGVMYAPVLEADFGVSGDEKEADGPDASAPARSRTRPSSKPASSDEAPGEQYIEKDLRKMSTSELKDLAEGTFNIDLDKEAEEREVKRWTVASLSSLILEAQEDGPAASAKPRKPMPPKPSESSEEGIDEAAVKEAFTRYDSGDLEDEGMVKALVNAGLSAEQADLLLDEFADDKALTPKDMARKAADLAGEPEEEEEEEEGEEEEAPKRRSSRSKGASKAKKKPEPEEEEEDEGELIEDWKDLKKGDDVSVYWANLEEWYDGKVISTGRSITVHYEDDTKEVLDPEFHTEVRRYN